MSDQQQDVGINLSQRGKKLQLDGAEQLLALHQGIELDNISETSSGNNYLSNIKIASATTPSMRTVVSLSSYNTTSTTAAYSRPTCSAVIQPSKLGLISTSQGTTFSSIAQFEEKVKTTYDVKSQLITTKANDSLNSALTAEVDENINMEVEGEKWLMQEKKNKQKGKRTADDEPSKNPEKKIQANKYHLLSSCMNFEIVSKDREVNANKNDAIKINEDVRVLGNKENDSECNTESTKKSGTIVNAKYCPPIIVNHPDVKGMMELLKMIEIDHKLHVLSGNKYKIYVRDLEAHKAIMNCFEEKGIQAYTYTPKEERPSSVILKGIHNSFSEKDVEKELKEVFPHIKFLKVSRFETTRSREGGYKLNMFIIQIAPGHNIMELIKTKIILYQTVHWEKPQTKGPVQCKRCQKFGHIANNCTMGRKCVKCANTHPAGECVVKEKSNSKELQCINCGQSGHPANYRGCPYYRKYLVERENKIKNSQGRSDNNRKVNLNVRNQAAFTPLNPVRTDKPYASYFKAYNTSIDYTKDNARNYQKNGENLIDDFINDSNNLYGMPLQEVIEAISRFYYETTDMTRSQKQVAYLRLTAKLFCNDPK